jgi:hypothetical protein
MDTATGKRRQSIVLSSFMTGTRTTGSLSAESKFLRCNATARIGKKWR